MSDKDELFNAAMRRHFSALADRMGWTGTDRERLEMVYGIAFCDGSDYAYGRCREIIKENA